MIMISSKIKRFFNKKMDAVGIIEIILILVILIGLVLLFKTQISGIVTKAFDAITKGSDKIIK